MLALARDADALVENFKVGGLAKYGLDYASVAAINPRLVYASITGFGQDGPYADRAGYDFIIQGMCGFMSVTGERDDLPGGGPQKAGVAITDLMTGMYASAALLAALAHRDRTGAGPVDRRLPVRLVGRDDVGDEHELSDRRRRAGARRQRAPEHRALPGVRVRRRPRDRRRRQRRPVRASSATSRRGPNGRRIRASRPTPRACASATRSSR